MNTGTRIRAIVDKLLQAAVLLNQNAADQRGAALLGIAQGELVGLRTALAPKTPRKKSTRRMK